MTEPTDLERRVAAAIADAAAKAREQQISSRLIDFGALARAAIAECFRWLPIEMAEKVTAKEILGSRWASGTCIREPFVSFWSPTLNKFYGSPTHYVPIPHSPEDQK